MRVRRRWTAGMVALRGWAAGGRVVRDFADTAESGAEDLGDGDAGGRRWRRGAVVDVLVERAAGWELPRTRPTGSTSSARAAVRPLFGCFRDRKRRA